MGGRKPGTHSQAERLLKLVAWARAGRTLRAREVARELAVSLRQAQRDLARLEATEADSWERDEEYGLRLVRARSGERLARIQVLSIGLGAQLTDFLWPPGRAGEIRGAIDELAQRLGATDQERLRAWSRRVAVIAPGQKVYKTASAVSRRLESILDAMIECRVVHIRYDSPKRRSIRTLEVHPLGLVLYRDGVYFIVDLVSGETDGLPSRILLALDRIKDALVGERRGAFTLPRDFDARRFFDDAFGIWPEGPLREVIFHVAAEHASYFKERRWHQSQRFEEKVDGSLLLRLRVASVHEICDFAMMLGDRAELLEPADLRELVRVRLRAALEKLGG